MGNRKPNLANLLAFLPPQEQFSPDMLLAPNAQAEPQQQPQGQPLSMVNQINRSQTSSNASPQLGYGQQFDQAFYKQMQDRASQQEAAQKQMQELQTQQPNSFKEADLSTLLAYGDQLTGSRLAQNYKAPTAAQERKAMIEKLRGEVTKSQQGIADDQLAYLKMKAQEEKDRMSEQRMMARMGGSGKPSEFEKSYSRKLGTSFSEYTTKDRPMIIANIDKVDEAINLMDSGKVIGQTTYTPDMYLGLKSPSTVIARDNIKSAIQDTLRPTLGAQFTENEGKRIMALAYDENLGPEINRQRAQKLKDVLSTKVQFQDDLLSYIRANNGSDAGFPYQNYGMVKVGGPTAPGTKTSSAQKRLEDMNDQELQDYINEKE